MCVCKWCKREFRSLNENWECEECSKIKTEPMILKDDSYPKREPIIEFKDEAQAYECLKEWQTRLFLDDWIIKIQLEESPVICDGKECSGMHNSEYSIKTSVISIYQKAFEENRITKHTAEHTIIHELLHLKYPMYNFETESPQDIESREMTHALIEQMAKSLIMVKYNLTFDWFKNF